MFMMLHNVEVGLLSALIIVIVPHIKIYYLCRKGDLGTIIMVTHTTGMPTQCPHGTLTNTCIL